MSDHEYTLKGFQYWYYTTNADKRYQIRSKFNIDMFSGVSQTITNEHPEENVLIDWDLIKQLAATKKEDVTDVDFS